MSQYYTEEQLAQYIKIEDSLNFEIVKTDSYNEEKIEKAIKKTRMVEELKCCAIQIAVVGTGKGALGSIKLNGREITVRKILTDAGVKLDLPQSTKLEEHDLTPRRIQRFFRYTIASYIKQMKTPSYLFTKYSDHDEKYRFVIFPGSEHLLKQRDECSYLYETYLRLDFQIGSSIADRIYRVLSTRGILTMEEMDKMKQKFIELKKSI